MNYKWEINNGKIRLAHFNIKGKWFTRTTRINILKHVQTKRHDRYNKRYSYYMKDKQQIESK